MTAVDESRTAAAAPPASVVTVTRGHLTPAELAAVLAVLFAAGAARAAAAPEIPAPSSAWTQRSRTRSPLPPPGPGAWRISALPY
jgi:hypothetical protein